MHALQIRNCLQQHQCCRGWLILTYNLVLVVFVQVLLFFTVAAYATESSYGVVDTLINPILSDYFGFTEKENSYFFVGLMFVFLTSSLLL